MDNEKCKTLIRLYSEKEFLWNPKTIGYRSKSAREGAWKQIGEKMHLPAAMLKNRMTSMLAAFRKEKSRIKQSKTSGRNSIYVSKWFAFDEFAFLADKDGPRLQSNCEPLFCDMKTEVEDASSTPSASDLTPFSLDPASLAETTFPNPYERHRSNSASNYPDDDILKDAFRDQEAYADAQYKDAYYTFGQYIANELRKYDGYTLTHVKKAISNVIFDADLGKYSRGQNSDTNDTSQQQVENT